MHVWKRLSRAPGNILLHLSQSCSSSVSRPCLQESIFCGAPVFYSLVKARKLSTRFASFWSPGSWDCARLLSPTNARYGGSPRQALGVSPVIEFYCSASEPEHHDINAAGRELALEEREGRDLVDSSQGAIEQLEASSGPEVRNDHSVLAESVIQEIKQRLAKRRVLAGEKICIDKADSILHHVRNKAVGVDAELDVAGNVLKQAFELLEADGYVPENEQRSLSVAVVGVPNAGKSALTNKLVGSKVSAVSRKTNTTDSDNMGVLTEGDTQLVIYDTPGLLMDARGYPIRSSRLAAVGSAWHMAETCEALVIVVDAHRQITRADKRVELVTRKLAGEDDWEKKRVLCLNKVDLIEDKKALLPLADEFSKLACFDRIFMISSQTGSGVKDVRSYLLDQAVLRIWAYEPNERTQKLQEALAMEVVKEHLYDRVHKEIPYAISHRHVSWDYRNDGSIRIVHNLIVEKEDHKKILVGKKGDLIRKIGTSARMDLQKLLDCTVHLWLHVRTKRELGY